MKGTIHFELSLSMNNSNDTLLTKKSNEMILKYDGEFFFSRRKLPKEKEPVKKNKPINNIYF